MKKKVTIVLSDVEKEIETLTERLMRLHAVRDYILGSEGPNPVTTELAVDVASNGVGQRMLAILSAEPGRRMSVDEIVKALGKVDGEEVTHDVARAILNRERERHGWQSEVQGRIGFWWIEPKSGGQGAQNQHDQKAKTP